MENQELDTPETQIEDLTVSEDTAEEVKGAFEGAGTVSISSFKFHEEMRQVVNEEFKDHG